MAEILSLKAARKAKARLESRTIGDANAAKFGRTKAEKALQRASADKARRNLDGARRE